MDLTVENVNAVLNEVLVEGDQEEGVTQVFGVVRTFLFETERLEAHRDSIREMLFQLPGEFRKSVGGGWSFLRVPFDHRDLQWGEQIHAERLLALGMAVGLVEKVSIPPEVLPGGVPYFVVID